MPIVALIVALMLTPLADAPAHGRAHAAVARTVGTPSASAETVAPAELDLEAEDWDDNDFWEDDAELVWEDSSETIPYWPAPDPLAWEAPSDDAEPLAEPATDEASNAPATTLQAGTVPAAPPVQPTPAISLLRPDGPLPLTSAHILENAKAMLGVRYLWGGNSDAGMDCSAFVSKAWGVPRLTTDSLHRVSYPITKDELLPGDILNLTTREDPRGYGHVRLMAAWANEEHTRIWVYEETPPRAVYHVIAYDPRYTPMRRINYLEDSAVPAFVAAPEPPRPPARPRPAATQPPATGSSDGAQTVDAPSGDVPAATPRSRPTRTPTRTPARPQATATPGNTAGANGSPTEGPPRDGSATPPATTTPRRPAATPTVPPRVWPTSNNQDDRETATPTPTRTPVAPTATATPRPPRATATATEAPPTATPTTPPEPTATATRVPPTATPTVPPEPTATRTPRPPTATPEPEPSTPTPTADSPAATPTSSGPSDAPAPRGRPPRGKNPRS